MCRENRPSLLNTLSNRSFNAPINRHKLAKLVIERQWSKLQKILQKSNDNVMTIFHEELILHQICKYQPTPEIIETILSLYPNLARKLNNDEQFPLHVASENGASSDVISLLCKSNPRAPGTKDMNGRTPLHLACLEYSNKYNDLGVRPKGPALSLTIKLLVQFSPMTVNAKDIDGKTALQYAYDTEIDYKSLRFLEKALHIEQDIRSVAEEKHFVMKKIPRQQDMFVCSQREVIELVHRERSVSKSTLKPVWARSASLILRNNIGVTY